jgi:hypothetical protein
MSSVALKTAPAGQTTIVAGTTGTTGTLGVSLGSQPIGPASARTPKDLEGAVYAYLQAMRALGHTLVNTSDVARALGLSQAMVESTIASLAKRGVKVA